MRELIRSYYKALMLNKYQKIWRKKNTHNLTTIGNLFPLEKVKVGKYTYGQLNIKFYGNKNEGMSIGNFCSIAKEVVFLTGGEHEYKFVSTYPFKKHVLKQNTIEAKSKGAIIIEDDVWIGYNSLILSGVTIGQGSIIGAGSVVARDIPPYSIFIKNKIIKKRFKEDIIKKLEKFDYSKIDKDDIEKYIDIFYKEPDEVFFNSELYKKNLK